MKFKVLVIVVLALAATAFSVRGVVRGLEGGGDLSMIYAAVTVWLDGGNPYRFEETIAIFRADGGDPEATKQPVDFVSLYPPSTFTALWPLGLVRWMPLHDLFTWLGALLMIPLAWVTVRVARVQGKWAASLVIGVCLLLGPVHTTLAMGQITLLCLAPLMWGLLLSRNGREIMAGALLGYACALKPQLAGMFVLVLPFLGRWRTFVVAGVVSAMMLGVGIARMELAGIDWLPVWRTNVELFTVGGTGDPRTSNPVWHLRMDLPMLLHVFTDNRVLVQVVTWLVVIGVMLVACIGVRKSRDGESGMELERELLAWSIVAVVTLLPLYHRFYDGVTLLIPFAWLFVRYRRGGLRLGDGIVLLMLCVFLLPNVNVATYELVNPRLPESLVTSTVWRATVMTCEVWALLIMLAVLISRLLRPAESARPQGIAIPA